MAGVGGALYAGTLGSVSAERFSLFQSLPLLLLTVVGGIGTAAGPLFAGACSSAASRSLIGTWPWLGNLNRVLPGTMGVALGRNPNGAVRDIGDRYARARRGAGRPRRPGRRRWWWWRPWPSPAPSPGGGSSSGLVAALVVWPQVAEASSRRRAPARCAAARAGRDRPDAHRRRGARPRRRARARRGSRGSGARRDDRARGRRRQRQLRRTTGARRGRLRGRRRDGHRPDRSERGRQDDALQRHLRAPAGRSTVASASTASTSRSSPPFKRARRGLGAHVPASRALRTAHGARERPRWPPTPPGAPTPIRSPTSSSSACGITELGRPAGRPAPHRPGARRGAGTGTGDRRRRCCCSTSRPAGRTSTRRPRSAPWCGRWLPRASRWCWWSTTSSW